MTWALNPYALAERILDRPIDSAEWAAAAEHLSEAFGGVDVRLLFEPGGDNPPLLRPLQQLLDGTLPPQKYEDAIKDDRVRYAQRLLKLSDEALARVLPFVMPIEDRDFLPPGAAGVADPAAVGIFRPAGPFVVDDVTFLDPVQGICADCYLISSMIALAWSMPAEWGRRLSDGWRETPVPELEFGFFPSADKLKVPALLPVWEGKDHRPMPVYAKSRDGAEAWPGLVEKAFVMHRRSGPEALSSKGYRWIGADDNRMFPQVACAMLMAGQPGAEGEGDLTLVKRSVTVSNGCQAGGEVTDRPTMATTIPDPAVERVNFARDQIWSETGLHYSHVYAVLGSMRGISKSGKQGQFVVLRDPHGYSPLLPAYADGVWEKSKNGRADVVLNQDGVFAIDEAVFDKCFFEVGWLTAAPPK